MLKKLLALLAIAAFGFSPAYGQTSSAPGVTFAQQTSGAILFGSGGQAASTSDPLRLFWDTINYKLGIGTNSPLHSVDSRGVVASINTFGQFLALQTTTGTGYRWTLNNDATFALGYTTDAFATVNNTRIFVDATGQVGIGNYSSGLLYGLQVAGTTGLLGATTMGGALTYGGIAFANTSTGASGGSLVGSNAPTIVSPTFSGTIGSTATNLSVVGGVVTASSSIGATAASPQLILNSTTAGAWRSAILFQNSGTTKWQVLTDIGSAGLNNFSFYDTVGGATRLFIDPTGKVGIGNYSSALTYNLEVTGSIGSSGGVTAASFNGNTFTTGTGTLTLAAGKTLTQSNTLTYTGTDGSTVNFGTGGTVLYSTSSITLGSTAMSMGNTYTTIAGAISWTGNQTHSSGSTYLTNAAPKLYFNNTSSGSWRSEINFQNSATNKWGILTDIGSAGVNNLSFYDYAGTATRIFVDSTGKVGIGNYSSALTYNLEVTGKVGFDAGSDNGTANFVYSNTGTAGANFKLIGNGAVTPSKTIRSFNGQLEVINHAYSLAILSLSDAGALYASGGLSTTTGTFSGAVSTGALTATTGNFSGTLTGVAANFSGSVTSTANGLNFVASNASVPYFRATDGTRFVNIGIDNAGDATFGTFINASNGLKIVTNGGTSTALTANSVGVVNLPSGLTATTGNFSGTLTGASYSGGTISGTTGTFSSDVFAGYSGASGHARLTTGGVGNNGYLGIYSNASTRVGYIGFGAATEMRSTAEIAAGYFTWYAAGVERMRLTNIGGLQIKPSADAAEALNIYNAAATKYITFKPENTLDTGVVGYWLGGSWGKVYNPGNFQVDGTTVLASLGIGGTAIYALDVLSSADAALTSRVYSSSTGASSSVTFSMQAGTRYVNRYVTYAGQYMYEYSVAGAIITRYSDFDAHYFRNTAGTEIVRIQPSSTTVPRALVSVTDTHLGLLLAGASKGIRINTTTTDTRIEGVDNTGVTTYQPLIIGGSILAFQSNNGTTRHNIDASGHFYPTADSTYSLGFTGNKYSVVWSVNGNFTGTLSNAGAANTATTSAVCINTTTGALSYNGTVGTCTVSALSYKTPLTPVATKSMLIGVKSIARFDSWQYKQTDENKGRFDNKVHVGLYADDVEKMDKRCAAYKDGKLDNYEDRCVIAYLAGAIKELSAANDNMAAEITLLKAAKK